MILNADEEKKLLLDLDRWLEGSRVTGDPVPDDLVDFVVRKFGDRGNVVFCTSEDEAYIIRDPAGKLVLRISQEA